MINDKYIDELPDIYKKSYLDYKEKIFETEEWGSHQPLLIHLVNTITDGDIIEIGMGNASTPLLHLLCEKLGRKLFSYEFDDNWIAKYRSFENDNHKMFLLNETMFSHNEYPLNQNKYAIALIDSHPVWTRQHSINFLKDSVDYFVVHDAGLMENGVLVPQNNYNLSFFKNVRYFEKVKRVSALATNKEITEELNKIFII
jgi:hypothetical protein